MKNTALVPTRHPLAKRQVLRIPHGAGTRVACLTGAVWVTEENDAHDLFLERGESLRLAQPGTALVYALEPASVLLERHAAPKAAAQPFGARFAELLAARWTSPMHAFARWS